MSRPSLILPPGTTLGGYEIEEVLGIGGMAVVYRAVQRSLGRPVALKVLNPRLAADETFRARFRREGAMVAALDHPSVVPVHDLGEVDGRLFLAMRLIEGETLADRLEDGGLSADEMRRVLRPISNALDAAHAAGVLHRDVKPQNVLLADDGTVYLADFGVAKSSSSDLTRTREFFGSVSYVAPEQIRGEAIGRAADVYALAVVAHQCLTGSVPFGRDTDAGVIHAHLETPPPPIGPINDPAAAALSRAVALGLEKHPDDRPASAGTFVDGVELALVELSHDVRSRRPAFPQAAAPSDLPLDATGGAHPPRGGTQPIAVQVPAAAPAAPAAVASAAEAPSAADVAAPDATPRAPRRRLARPRLRYALAALLLALIVVGAGATLVPRGGSTAQAEIGRLAASGAPERVTRAAREARRRALDAAAARRAAAARAEARRKAAAKRNAAAKQAATPSAPSSVAPSTSSGASSGSSVAPSSGQTAPSSSGSTRSSGSSGSSSPSAGACDFPPC